VVVAKVVAAVTVVAVTASTRDMAKIMAMSVPLSREAVTRVFLQLLTLVPTAPRSALLNPTLLEASMPPVDR
jgi:hypothetical protein